VRPRYPDARGALRCRRGGHRHGALPVCREHVELYVDPDSQGQLVEDCAVCCRPWLVTIERAGGRLRVQVVRAQ
jgi:hypothetical protein